ncbi:MAG: hypothetical protein FWF36_06830, partial [Propionibacteriaceae bacterium]|nr:hypothetical protein [Propionibacteriaceae bacterium]
MEYAILVLAVLLFLLVVTHSYKSYKAILKRVKDPSRAVMLRPPLGVTIPLALGSLMFLLMAYPMYNIPTATGPHNVSMLMLGLVVFVIVFPFGWLPSVMWHCLEPGVAHVTRSFGFRHADVDASQ